ncbi:MAG: PP2C family protein-serine/threonine phosphatase [Planctomycetota bacterium]|jgi:sigma-B regulation protein RsbU (phosphoserine phosphatase)
MIKPPIPVDDQQRVADLDRLDMLLTEPEAAFDQIVNELARIFSVPGVMMSFTDRDTQYYKAAIGLPEEFAATREEPRELSVCSFVIGENRMMVIEDLLSDDRFRDNPIVLSSGARFYAGTPLRSDEGRAIGTLCLVDVEPRTIGPQESELLRLVAEGVMAQVKLQIASRQLLKRTQQIEQDLQLAVQMQRFLLPPPRLEGEGWRISHVYRPFEHLAGDFLAVHSRADGRRMIFVADVSGHGTSAALTTAMAKTAFHRASLSVDTPGELLTTINRELVDMVPPGQFMTAVAAIFDPARRAVTLSSAGHPHPLLVRGTRVEVVEHENEMLLMVLEDQEYSRQTTIELPPGDRLLIYTDGAIEAVNPDGNRLDVAGLCRLVEEVVGQGPPDFLKGLSEHLDRHIRSRFHDDVALLCIESLS